jgi:hypothetical protein
MLEDGNGDPTLDQAFTCCSTYLPFAVGTCTISDVIFSMSGFQRILRLCCRAIAVFGPPRKGWWRRSMGNCFVFSTLQESQVFLSFNVMLSHDRLIELRQGGLLSIPLFLDRTRTSYFAFGNPCLKGLEPRWTQIDLEGPARSQYAVPVRSPDEACVDDIE